MKKSVLWAFVTFWILDSLLLYFAKVLYPAYFVLGTRSMSLWVAVFVAGFIWTLFVWLGAKFVKKLTKVKGRAVMFGFYFVVNFVALWLTARIAPISGFGVARFVWVAYLALIADVFQYLLWKAGNFKKMMK